MSLFKGWLGEKMAMFNMWFSLPAKTYHRFHGIILPSQNGTTQIDHLIVSVYGLFIVETKNKKDGFMVLMMTITGHKRL